MEESIISPNIDIINPLQKLKNHVEYAWNIHLQEKITQFYFQLVRTEDHTMLENKFQEILRELFNQDCEKMNETVDEKKDMVFRMIAQTRDIISGKGEYKLAYMMLYNWAKYDMKGAVRLITHFVSSDTKLKEPYGSWKDAKYLAAYCCEREEEFSYKLFKYIIGMINIQLICDNTLFDTQPNNAHISLCAKWVPRENKAHGWMYKHLALDYYTRSTEKTTVWNDRSENYAKMNYRRILTKLNKHLDTVQIKMCNKTWRDINFDNTTSITLNKMQYAFSFKDKAINTRTQYDTRTQYNNQSNGDDKEDRIQCAQKFSKWCASKKHIPGKQIQGKQIHGKHVSMYDFVKTAYQLEAHYDKELVDLLNKQWENNGERNNKQLEYMIPLIDTSECMTQNNNRPLYNAIGLGIRIAEQSKLGKRCITLSYKPSWVNLEHVDNFYDSIMSIKAANSTIHANISVSMELILQHIKETKMTNHEVSQLTLVVLSNMQFDRAESLIPIDVEIENQYEKVGIEISGIPYKPPRIIFWNLMETDGFPTVSFRPGVAMISGYSPQLMNTFINTRKKSTDNYNPYNILKGIINRPRYNFLHA
jgi:hypothetical protein